MPLEAGVRLGPYEIVGPISADGAEEIYKATDAEQNRSVVIKPLPACFSESAEMRQHLERQVKTLSGLNHPHICTPHEIRREGESEFLVMEYIEGETLAQRLEKGPLPLDEALKAAVAMADALHRAHGEDLVHGSLRPVNVMLMAEGGVKLLDFGLTKLGPPKAAPVTPSPEARFKGALADLPDDVVRYMAPEQVEGREPDERSDIFSFGAIFYEMVTGEKAFEGRNRAMLVAAISALDPYPLSKTQPDSPPMLDHIAQRCLAKDPEDRWQTAHDLLAQLRWVAEGGDVLLAAARARQKRERRLLAVLAAVVFVLTIAASQAVAYFRGDRQSEPFQFRVPIGGLNPSDIAISPDGKLLAVVAKPNTQDAQALYVRPTGATEFRRLVGTEEATQPFWSPDSRSIGFTAGGRVKRVDAAGGAPKDLGEAPGFTGGAWGSAGVIVFGSAKGLYRISAEGGKPELATTVEKQETGHFWPSFLPDGQHYLYLVWSADTANRGIFASVLGSKEKVKVMTAESNVEFADPGYVLFHRDATLFAQQFDAKALKTSGQPFHIADQVEFISTNGRGNFDVSQTGSLAYFQAQGGRGGGAAGRGQMVTPFQWGWRDRNGNPLELVGETATFGDMDLSPDGKLVAVTQPDATAAGADIYVIDWQRAGVSSRLTLDPGDDINPVWSRPTGDRIAFTTYRKGNADIYIKNSNGSGDETPLLATPENESIEAWSDDGRYIAYKQGPAGSEDIWILPLFGEKTKFPFVQGSFHKDEPQFSHDGKWLAYTSDESGSYQVWVVSFPKADQRLQVSKDGGGQPRWREDDKELFFRSPNDGTAFAVDITLTPKLSAGLAQALFSAGVLNTVISKAPDRHQWAVASKGQRFLARMVSAQGQVRGGNLVTAPNVPFALPGRIGQGASAPAGQAFVSTGLTVIRNWQAGFQKEKTP